MGSGALFRLRRRRLLTSRGRKVAQWLVALFFLLSWPAIARGQSAADSLAELAVDLWPDYDQPAVLVLLTGRLPEGVSLPARVTIPLPADATLNAVARLTPEGAMVDDIEFTNENGALTVTVPEERFRVEYYAPYETEDGQSSYLFEWFSNALSVDRLSVIIQQPAAAEAMASTPGAAESTVGPDGLTYLHLPEENVPAGDSYWLEFSYDATGGELTSSTVAAQPAAQTALEPVAPPPAAESSTRFSRSWPLWLAGAAGLLIVVLAGRQVIARGKERRPAKPAGPRATSSRAASTHGVDTPSSSTTRQAGGSKGGAGSVRFCHQCGSSADAADRFCRNCGTKLRGR